MQAGRRTPVQGELPTLGTVREQTLFEPRLAARWALTEVFGVDAAVGIYHSDKSNITGLPILPVLGAKLTW